jgi:hypothetical protein
VECRNSAFNAQGSRVIIVVVQAGALKKACSKCEGKRKEGQNWMKLSLPQKARAFLSPPSPPLSNANVLFCKFLKNLTQFWTKLKVLVLCFLDFTKTLIYQYISQVRYIG